MERLVTMVHGANMGASGMKQIILRFLLANSSHIFDLLISEDDARSKMEEWRNNRVNYFHGYDSSQNRYYAIKTAEIASMFTIDLDKLKQQQEELRKQQQQMGQQQMGQQPSIPATLPSY